MAALPVILFTNPAFPNDSSAVFVRDFHGPSACFCAVLRLVVSVLLPYVCAAFHHSKLLPEVSGSGNATGTCWYPMPPVK